jgi:hypothetical protein
MDAERLDQREHLRLGTAQQHRPPASPQTTGAEAGEVDGDIGLRAKRAGDGAAPEPLRGAVLISGAEKNRR